MRFLSAAYTDYDCCVQVYTPHKYDMYVKVKNKLNINVQNIGTLKTKQSKSSEENEIFYFDTSNSRRTF